MNIFGNIRQWHRNRQTQNILNKLPDAILNDVGLERYGKNIVAKR